MKLTDEDIKRLTISKPTKGLEKHTKYGGWGERRIADDNLDSWNKTVKEQMTASLEEIHRLRGGKPIAILFWQEEIDKDTVKMGWFAWTDKKRQTSLPA